MYLLALLLFPDEIYNKGEIFKVRLLLLRIVNVGFKVYGSMGLSFLLFSVCCLFLLACLCILVVVDLYRIMVSGHYTD